MKTLRQDAFLFWEWCKAHWAVQCRPNWQEFKRLREAYGEPGRFYHTFQHIAECLKFVNLHYGPHGDIWIVKFALFYHDVVYDVNRKDNEELSAQQWEAYAKSIGLSRSRFLKSHMVADMIRMTANHKVAANKPLIYSMMCDADMHIFLCPDSHYLDYARGIWREYQSFGRDAYLSGRLAFLNSVDPKDMFYTHQARALVNHARANLDLEKTILETDPDRLLV